MKKVYIIPSTVETNIELEAIIATSMLGISNDITVNTSEEDTQLGRNRRGIWGDLWNDQSL